MLEKKEKEKKSARTSGGLRSIALLSVGLPLYRTPMLFAWRGIRQGLFCRFDTVSPWRQLKGYRVSYDRRRRLSPAAGIIKLKSHCAAALRGRAAINVTFIVQRNVTGQLADNYSRLRWSCTRCPCYDRVLCTRLVKAKSRKEWRVDTWR